ncbi:MAG: hypothetical protein HRT47_07410 [Candidatus Caenarcaniphilales bacterium]|nr:hypothetical protein [Candidatus Caenarcaniphilales bacterium]
MNQLHKLSLENYISKEELEKLFDAKLVLDDSSQFLGLTYEIERRGDTEYDLRKPLKQNQTVTNSKQRVFIKDGNFKTKKRSKKILQNIYLGTMAILLAPIALPVIAILYITRK